jgi:putative transposase
MNAITVRHQAFGRYDRIQIGKANYRYVRWEEQGEAGGVHILQLTADGLLQDSFRPLTDKQIAELQRRKNFKVEAAYYTKALNELRLRHDDSNLLALSEEEARTAMWKTEWCVRFHKARISPTTSFRPKLTHDDIKTFIEGEMHYMNRWYIQKFKEPRPLGRPVVVAEGDGAVKERKPFDYPSPSGLRNWLRLYERTGNRMAAFAPRYHRCGNRAQMDAELSAIVDKCVLGYADRGCPTRSDIHDQVEIAVKDYNKKHKDRPPAKVSQATVNRRISNLEPFFVDVGRLGVDRAVRKYTLVGKGVEVDLPLERVEMDDWEADLHVLLAPTEIWTRMTKEQRAAVARVRCTVTVAIDCRTRCIVGLNVSESTPSTPAAKATLRSITQDKAEMGKYGGARRDWPMFGKPDNVFTDGGPVFQGEFHEAVAACGLDPTRPDPDPRQRGTIESFFRYLRRSCRYFTGQAFSNVVVKADYDAEKMASLTVDEFRKAIIRFIVDIYHNRKHRGLAGETPYSAWHRLTGKSGPPATVTPAQCRAAFGFRHDDVAVDNQGVFYLGISYNSEALGEILMKRGFGTKVTLIIDPEDLGTVFVLVPANIRKHLQSRFPMEMHGEFLEVPAVDERFQGVTLSARLLGNQDVLDFVKQSQKEGDVYRIDANEALTEKGKKAAQRAGIPTHLLTKAAYERVVAKFRVTGRQSTGERVVGDEPVSTDQNSLGKVVATSKRNRPKVAPKQTQPEALANPPEAPADPAVPPAAQDQVQLPRTGSRSVNQGDDD